MNVGTGVHIGSVSAVYSETNDYDILKFTLKMLTWIASNPLRWCPIKFIETFDIHLV